MANDVTIIPPAPQTASDTRVLACEPGRILTRPTTRIIDDAPQNDLNAILARLAKLEQEVARLTQENLAYNRWADNWAKDQMHLAQIIREDIPPDFREIVKAFREFIKE